MRNKFILILGLCALICASACQPTDEPSKKDGLDLIVRLSINGSTTRTSGVQTVDDEDFESNISISGLKLIFVSDDASKTVRVADVDCYEYDDATNTISAHLPPAQYTGKWRLYVLANWPESITLDTSSYDAFVGSYSGLTSSQLASMWQPNHFPMVNIQNGATVAGVDKAGVPIELKNEGVVVTPEVTVTLERIATKVRADVSPFIHYGLVGTQMGGHEAVFGVSKVVFDGIAMINNVNSFNLVQQWASDGNLITPSTDEEYDMSAGYYNTSVPPASWSNPGTVMYCLENSAPDYVACGGTHLDASEGTRMKGRVTGIIIRAKVQTMSYFKSEADTDNGGTPGGENLVLDPIDGIWTRAAESDAAFRTIYKYKGFYFADWQQLFAQNPELGSTSADATPSLLRSKGVNVYENGYMYYVYWIETGGNTYVARNVFYDLLITEVNSFGDDQPCGSAYLRTDPLGTDGAKLGISLKISDWDTKDTQHYTL